MLVDNKFIMVSLPRCASTSFYISCLKGNISTQHHTEIDYKNTTTDLDLDSETLANVLFHSHEKLIDLRSKFGYEYEVVAIKRDRHQRFISLWKHIIDMCAMGYPIEVTNKLKSLTIDDIFIYTSKDLVSTTSEIEVLNRFSKILNIGSYFDEYMKNMLLILIRPTSFWHNDYQDIKWFDFDKLDEFENWVSNKLNKPFKLYKSNGSQHFECNLILNAEFINRYNDIYDYYDLGRKHNKTLI